MGYVITTGVTGTGTGVTTETVGMVTGGKGPTGATTGPTGPIGVIIGVVIVVVEELDPELLSNGFDITIGIIGWTTGRNEVPRFPSTWYPTGFGIGVGVGITGVTTGTGIGTGIGTGDPVYVIKFAMLLAAVKVIRDFSVAS